MVQRLPWPDEKSNPDPRGDLDRWLDVHLWKTPTTRHTYDDTNAPVGAPAWWHGDEEATDSFLRGMGVKSINELRGGGGA
jgi:hypothetical protein